MNLLQAIQKVEHDLTEALVMIELRKGVDEPLANLYLARLEEQTWIILEGARLARVLLEEASLPFYTVSLDEGADMQ